MQAPSYQLLQRLRFPPPKPLKQLVIRNIKYTNSLLDIRGFTVRYRVTIIVQGYDFNSVIIYGPVTSISFLYSFIIAVIFLMVYLSVLLQLFTSLLLDSHLLFRLYSSYLLIGKGFSFLYYLYSLAFTLSVIISLLSLALLHFYYILQLVYFYIVLRFYSLYISSYPLNSQDSSILS